MPLVETREAAAPATSAAEKFRLVIIMVLILCIEGVKSAAEGLPAEGSLAMSLSLKRAFRRSARTKSALLAFWSGILAALRMREGVS
jgi:hypothetical protein